jgi:hypothetical protein
MALKNTMSYMPSMQYLDVSYDSTDNLGLGYTIPRDQTIKGGGTLKRTNFLQTNENSLVNLQDHTQSLGSMENFNPVDHQQSSQNMNISSHAYASFDPRNPLNKQPSIGEILNNSSFQITKNMDQTYRLTHRRPSNTCLSGVKEMPK